MKNILFIISIFLVFNSCIVETDDSHHYKTYLKNNSTQVMNVKFYKEDNLFMSQNIPTNDSIILCEYNDEGFASIDRCTDSIIIAFPNGEGYINSNTFSNNFNFQNDRHLFGSSQQGYNYLGNYIFTFTITQEDYTNAHTLP